jgi:hypothetical protein
MQEDPPFEDAIYDQFPSGEEDDNGVDQGFNTWVRVNDPDLFTEAAKEIPAIAEFLLAPFSLSFAQFKSSHRETEYFLHKPHKAMTGQVEGIEGTVHRFPEDPMLATLVMNHEHTLALHITRTIVVADSVTAAQLIHKEEAPPS